MFASLSGCVSFHRGVDGEAAFGAPPPPRVEVPAPRPGYVWAPGYWGWQDGRHVWVEGHWIPARQDEHWVADQWERQNGRWHFEPGHWAHNTTAVLH